MDVFAIFRLLGGLAMFLFGMNIMGAGLEKLSGSKLERTMERMTTNKIKGVGLGFGVTVVMQSSSATTVMLVGFVNASIMTLYQATNVIMGANIGTTLTGWITALTGLESDNFWLSICKPANFSPLVALAGIVMLMACKGRKKDLGSTLLGFAILMFGMTTMSESMAPLANDPSFQKVLLLFNNPLLGLLVGAVLTGIIQSSAASVGMLQTLAQTNGLTYNMAIPIIMGQNIGTCVTALLSCIGANKNAKRTAMVHLYFNMIGSVFFIALYFGAQALFPYLFSFSGYVVNTFGIAMVHTVFNILSTLVMLPLSKYLCRLAELTIKDKATAEKTAEPQQFLDPRFLNSPGIAVEQCKKAIRYMSVTANESLTCAISSFDQLNEKVEQTVREKEDILDRYEDQLGTYLVRLSSKELSDEESREISKILHSISDFERIGDHALNILGTAQEMRDKSIHFSAQAEAELRVLTKALLEIMDMTCRAFSEEDLQLASQVEPLEQVIDELKDEIKNRHIIRLREGACTIELGFILNDLLTNYERISDHCSNLAACMIELEHTALDTHTYLNAIKYSGQEEFVESFNEYGRKYALPEAAKTE